MPQYIATTLNTAGAYLTLMNWNTKAPAGSASRLLGGPAASVVFDPMERFVAANCTSSSAQFAVASLPALAPISVPEPPAGNGLALALSPDGSILAASHQTAPYLHLYETTSWGKMPAPADMPPAVPQCMAFSPDGSKLAVGFSNAAAGHWRVYNTADWSAISGLPALPGLPSALAFTDDGTKVISSGSYHAGRIIDLASKTMVSPVFTATPVHGFAAHVVSGQAVFKTIDSSFPIRVVDIASHTEVEKLATPFPAGNSRVDTAITPDGRYLLICNNLVASEVLWAAWRTHDWSAVDPALLGIHSGASTAVFAGPDHAQSLTLRGDVRDIGGYVASRRVRVYERLTGRLCAETVSSPVDGSYEIEVYEGDVPYDVQFMADDAESLNDLFYARAIAGTP